METRKRKYSARQKQDTAESAEQPRKRGGWFTDMRYGRSVSLTFFRQNAWFLFLVMIALIGLMGMRYQTKTRMQEIRKLENELVLSQSEKLQEKSDYMSLVRESEMERMVNEEELHLSFQEQPPYKIHYEK